MSTIENQEITVEQIVAKAFIRQRRAIRNSIVFYMVTFLISGIWLFFSYHQISKLEQLSNNLNSNIETLKTQKAELEEQTKRIKVALGPDSFNEQQIKSSVEGRRQQALNIAFNLYHRQPPVPFKWSGKKPKEGFDTSAFIAYILSQVNVLNKPETYWSGKLESDFGSKNFKIPSGMKLSDFASQELKPGDVIFYDNKLLMLYLGDDRCMGMLPTKGLVITEVDFGFNIINIWKVPYEQL